MSIYIYIFLTPDASGTNLSIASSYLEFPSFLSAHRPIDTMQANRCHEMLHASSAPLTLYLGVLLSLMVE